MSTTSREAVELAAQPTLSERAAATPDCPCGIKHQAGSKVARDHAAKYAPALPHITGEDLRGVLSVWRGAMWIRNGQPLIFGQQHRDVPPVAGKPFLTQDHVIGLLRETGAPVARLAKGADRLPIQRYEAAADLLHDQLLAEAGLGVAA